MLIEPVSGNTLFESTLMAKSRLKISAKSRRRAIDAELAPLYSEEAERELKRETSKLTNKARVEIVMALVEDVPELGLSAYWLATGGLVAMKTDSDASIVILSTVISIFHMVKCIQRYRTIKQITKHAEMAGKDPSTSTQCCISGLDDDAKEFKLETYGIKDIDGFMRGNDGFGGKPAV